MHFSFPHGGNRSFPFTRDARGSRHKSRDGVRRAVLRPDRLREANGAESPPPRLLLLPRGLRAPRDSRASGGRDDAGECVVVRIHESLGGGGRRRPRRPAKNDAAADDADAAALRRPLTRARRRVLGRRGGRTSRRTELKARLAAMGVSATGLKPTLVDRLVACVEMRARGEDPAVIMRARAPQEEERHRGREGGRDRAPRRAPREAHRQRGGRVRALQADREGDPRAEADGSQGQDEAEGAASGGVRRRTSARTRTRRANSSGAARSRGGREGGGGGVGGRTR